MRRLHILFTVLLLVLLASNGVLLAQSAGEISSATEVLGWEYVISISDEMVDTSAFVKAPPYRIGFLTGFQGNTWAIQFTRELFEEAEKYGDLIAEIVHLDANLEIPRQISSLEDVVAKGVDAIVIDPVSPTALGGVLK